MDKEQILTQYAKQHIQDKIIYQNSCDLGRNFSLTVLTYDCIFTLYKFYLNGVDITYSYIMLLPEEIDGMFQAVNSCHEADK